jgi:hypothetical protein
MSAARSRENPRNRKASIPQKAPEPEGATPPAWELIENGRYMPRRIRGSFRGRELG